MENYDYELMLLDDGVSSVKRIIKMLSSGEEEFPTDLEELRLDLEMSVDETGRGDLSKLFNKADNYLDMALKHFKVLSKKLERMNK